MRRIHVTNLNYGTYFAGEIFRPKGKFPMAELKLFSPWKFDKQQA